MCSISFPNMYIRSLCVQYPYRACIVRNLCLSSLRSVSFRCMSNILTSHMLPICVQYPYRTCIFDLYVSNILTGHVYFETFVRVIFGRSLSCVCLKSLPDICSLYVFNILTEHVYSIFLCPISLPGMYISKPLLESPSVGVFPVYV